MWGRQKINVVIIISLNEDITTDPYYITLPRTYSEDDTRSKGSPETAVVKPQGLETGISGYIYH